MSEEASTAPCPEMSRQNLLDALVDESKGDSSILDLEGGDDLLDDDDDPSRPRRRHLQFKGSTARLTSTPGAPSPPRLDANANKVMNLTFGLGVGCGAEEELDAGLIDVTFDAGVGKAESQVEDEAKENHNPKFVKSWVTGNQMDVTDLRRCLEDLRGDSPVPRLPKMKTRIGPSTMELMSMANFDDIVEAGVAGVVITKGLVNDIDQRLAKLREFPHKDIEDEALDIYPSSQDECDEDDELLLTPIVAPEVESPPLRFRQRRGTFVIVEDDEEKGDENRDGKVVDDADDVPALSLTVEKQKPSIVHKSGTLNPKRLDLPSGDVERPPVCPKRILNETFDGAANDEDATEDCQGVDLNSTRTIAPSSSPSVQPRLERLPRSRVSSGADGVARFCAAAAASTSRVAADAAEGSSETSISRSANAKPPRSSFGVKGSAGTATVIKGRASLPSGRGRAAAAPTVGDPSSLSLISKRINRAKPKMISPPKKMRVSDDGDALDMMETASVASDVSDVSDVAEANSKKRIISQPAFKPKYSALKPPTASSSSTRSSIGAKLKSSKSSAAETTTSSEGRRRTLQAPRSRRPSGDAAAVPAPRPGARSSSQSRVPAPRGESPSRLPTASRRGVSPTSTAPRAKPPPTAVAPIQVAPPGPKSGAIRSKTRGGAAACGSKAFKALAPLRAVGELRMNRDEKARREATFVKDEDDDDGAVFSASSAASVNGASANASPIKEAVKRRSGIPSLSSILDPLSSPTSCVPPPGGSRLASTPVLKEKKKRSVWSPVEKTKPVAGMEHLVCTKTVKR